MGLFGLSFLRRSSVRARLAFEKALGATTEEIAVMLNRQLIRLVER
jgi:hypothetical protein